MGIASDEFSEFARSERLDVSPPVGSTRHVILASLVGNVMEWYDFAIYGYFAVTIGNSFFPSGDAVASTLAAFGVFAAGFLARPLGGVLFGYVGDRLGRKRALTLSVLLMALTTLLMGVLPTHAAVGDLAGFLLVALRLLQGLAVGGEFTTSIVYVVEHAGPGHHGRDGSWMSVGAIAGMLLGSAVGALMANLLSAEALSDWGWRVPFIFGLVVGIAGFMLRGRLPELAGADTPHERLRLVEALRAEWRTILRLVLLAVPNGVVFYILFVYAVSYLQTLDGIPPREALDVNTIGMAVLVGWTVLGGVLSDRFGRRPVAAFSMAAVLLLSWPLFILLGHRMFAVILAAQLCFAAFLGLYCGQLPATLVEALPRRVRCTGVSLSYNLSVGLLGGLTPLFATWMIKRTGDEMTPAYMLMIAAAITLLAIWRMPESAGRLLR